MTRKHLVAAMVLVGVVLVVDRALLVGSSGAQPAPAPPPPRVPSPPPIIARGAPFPSAPQLHADAVAAPSEEPERVAAPVSDRAMGRDPEGAKAVLALIGKHIGTPAEKVAAIKDTIVQSGVCTASECMKTKAALTALIDPKRLTVRSSDCYEVACVVEISGQGHAIERALMDLERTSAIEWPVPVIFTKPTVAADGSQSAMWVFFNPE